MNAPNDLSSAIRERGMRPSVVAVIAGFAGGYVLSELAAEFRKVVPVVVSESGVASEDVRQGHSEVAERLRGRIDVLQGLQQDLANLNGPSAERIAAAVEIVSNLKWGALSEAWNEGCRATEQFYKRSVIGLPGMEPIAPPINPYRETP